MKNKDLLKNLMVLWISVTAFVCAIINVHIVRNMLKAEETSVKERNNDEETTI